MKKQAIILYCLLILGAISAFGQTVLTINGQCVPTTCSSTPPPPTCTGGQVLQGNICVCPAGTWNGQVCVISPPPISGYELLDMNWGSGKNYLQKPWQSVAGTTVAAYRINAQQFLNDPSQTANTASIQFYETGSVIACVSNVPGAFQAMTGLNPCLSVVGPGGKAGLTLAGPGFSTDAALTQYGWKRLPASLDGYYYINVKLPDSTALPSTFWLLYN